MAKLVQLIGVQHNPLLYRRMLRAEEHPGMVEARAGYERMRQKLAAARPDVLLVIANDHLSQWFTDNMPAFLVGKAPRARGPFPHETEEFGLPTYTARVDVDVARAIIEGGFERGVDFAYSDEFVLDHAFTLPLTFLRPEMDLPIVPLFTNVMAPPVPPSSRFYQVGEAVRAIVDELPADLRVAVLASGHLSVEIGGPRPMREAPDPEFDARVVAHVREGNVAGLLRDSSWERMLRAGNFTAGLLNFVALVGVAGGQPATAADCVFLRTSSTPFFTWDLEEAEA